MDGSGNPAGFVTTGLATRTVTANLSATNPTATCTYTNQKHPDLAITKTGPASVNVGAPITYTITATNNGPGNVTGASIADTVPANITAVTWTCTATGTADCNTIPLAPAPRVSATASVSGTWPSTRGRATR